MKIKILMVPFMICLIIILMIWVVYPAFSNPASNDGLLEKRATLKAEEEKLKQMNNKSDNSKKLYSELTGGSSKKDTISKYVPDTAKEEQIIDNLNFMAISDGLAVINLSTSQESTRDTALAASADPSLGGGASAVPQLDSNGNPIIVMPKPKATTIKVEYSVLGNYDKIKNLFEKIYKLERFNKIDALEISRPALKEGEAEVSDNLQADAELSFSFLKKLNAIQDLENPIFLKDKYDMGIADKILSEKSTNIPGMPSEPSGRSNPFLP